MRYIYNEYEYDIYTDASGAGESHGGDMSVAVSIQGTHSQKSVPLYIYCIKSPYTDL